MTRRQFGLCSFGAMAGAPAASEQAPWSGPAEVKTVFIGVPKPTWPNPKFNVEQARAEAATRLAELERRHPNVLRLTGGELVRSPEDAAAWVKALDPGALDGVLIVPLTSGSDGLVLAVARGGLPALVWNQPYLGHAWGSMAAWVRAGNRGDVVTSSDPGDLDIYARVFYALHKLRTSKVLVVVPERQREAHGRQAAEFSRRFGTTFRYLSYRELTEAYEAVQAAHAAREAELFTRAALRIIEPSPEEILRALRFYLGVKNLLAAEKANAITIDCLGGIQRGELPGYPCVAWSRLNDGGLYGVCQADLDCTMTQLLLTPFTGKPGFLFNAVFETSRNELIQAHCVAPTAMEGLGGPRSPYIVRSHLETAAGVSLQVLLPAPGVVTVVAFEGPQRLRAARAEVLGNVVSQHGCRTQLRTRVRDARRMMAGFSGGLGVHRVSFYGDYVDELDKLGRMLALEILQEA